MMLKLKKLLVGTLRAQLIVGMTLVIATIMSLFILDQIRRQHSVMFEQQTDQASALARSVATSAAVWVAARDYGGLHEIVASIAPYPDLQHAIVLDLKGLVLAHSDAGRQGLYLTDMPKQGEARILHRGPSYIDVASPVMLAQKQIGWVRIGLSTHSIDARLAQLTRDGVFYALIAILLSVFVSALASRYLTRRLHAIQQVANSVQSGVSAMRVVVSGDDEAAHLARQINFMLDTLVQREETLRLSEEQMATSQQIGGTGSWIYYIASNKIRASAHSLALFGFPNEVRDYPLEDFLGCIENSARVSRTLAAVIGEGLGYDDEFTINPRDGSAQKIIHSSGRLEKDGQGNPLRIFGFIQDVTERKKSEEERNWLLKIIEDAPDFIATYDMQGHLKYLNKAGARLVGLPEEVDLTRLEIKDMHSAQAGRRVLEEGIPAVLMQGYWQSENALQSRDGHEIPVSQLLMVHRDASGNPQLLSTIMRDITFSKQTEDKLRENERKLSVILDSVDAFIYLKDTRGRYLFANRPVRVLFDATMEQIIGQTDEKFFDAETAALLRVKELPVFEQGETLRSEDTNFINGQARTYLSTKLPLRNEAGEIYALCGISTDISLRKQREAELLRSNVDLEQFSYAVSHDMRQPLRMISSYLQLLEIKLSDQLNGEKRDYFDCAIEGAKRIDQMLVALLEYSRVGRTGEPQVWVDSRSLLDLVLKFLQPELAEAQAQLSIVGEWPSIYASRDEITRLMQNLIGNAAKYRVAGRVPEIEIASQAVKNEWTLRVTDNGIGIKDDQIKQLFQMFRRLHSRETFQGTGVGLALCRKIAEHHQGRIYAESAGVGQGSTFCVVLPVLRR